MTFTYDETMVSDLYKDARGVRPGTTFWEMWNECLPAGKQLVWDNLCRELDEAMAREKEEQRLAIANFEKSVQNIMLSGAGDRKTAIRWIVDGLDVDGDYSYACYKLGLPYEMATELKGN
jgi:hypothetical protein